MDEALDVVIPLLALLGSIVLAFVLLARARSRAKPEPPESGVQVPASASKRQRRIIEKLDPVPDIPTVMDLVRAEVEELGLEEIPGAAELPRPVLLKVYRRDEAIRMACTHDGIEYRVAAGVEPADAEDGDVDLYCEQCGDPSGTNEAEETFTE